MSRKKKDRTLRRMKGRGVGGDTMMMMMMRINENGEGKESIVEC